MEQVKNIKIKLKGVFNFLHKILNKIPIKKIGLVILIVFVIFLIIGIYNNNKTPDVTEAFQGNSEKVIIKTNPKNIYDNFYANIYEHLFTSDMKDMYEIIQIKKVLLDKWKPKQNIKILDAGCGTGRHCYLLKNKYNYDVVGIDSSKHMVQKALQNNNKSVLRGDLKNKDLFRARTFSHITCFFFTIYYFEDPGEIFQNFHTWLKPKGYMCIHLVDKEKFDPVLEKFSSLIPMFSPQKHSSKRQTDSTLTFKKFKYTSTWKLKPEKKSKFIEEFTFKDGRRRKHIHTLFIKPLNSIVRTAKQNGFMFKRKIDLTPANHENEFIYIFQKV